MQVQIGNYIYPLIEGQPLQIPAGSTLRVFFSFSYMVDEDSSVSFWASLYQYRAGLIDRISGAQTKSVITLPQSIEPTTYEGYIDIKLQPAGMIPVGGISPGIYGLLLELRGYEDVKIDDCIQVTEAPGIISGITEMMGPLIMIAMMGMMVPMMSGMAEGME